MNITQTLKNNAVNGVINLDKVLKVAGDIDSHLTEAKDILQQCEKQVGMHLGERILSLLAAMDGTRFNAVDYHYEKPVGEQ